MCTLYSSLQALSLDTSVFSVKICVFFTKLFYQKNAAKLGDLMELTCFFYELSFQRFNNISLAKDLSPSQVRHFFISVLGQVDFVKMPSSNFALLMPFQLCWTQEI